MLRDRLIRSARRERFLVTCVDEETFEGVLLDVDRHHLIFAAAVGIAGNGDRLQIDNDLWLPRARIKYLQGIRN